jgi:hypothetical protein
MVKKFKKKTKVQSVILSRDKFKCCAEVKRWIKKNKFILMKTKKKPIKITKQFYRIRQRDPWRFKNGTLRTKESKKGIKFVIGVLK